MGFLDSLKAWFSRETAEARDVGEKTRSQLEADLARREAQLSATPEERMAQIQDEIEGSEAAFEDLQAKIEGRGALADAAGEVARIDQEDVLDLESEEVIPPEPPPAG